MSENSEVVAAGRKMKAEEPGPVAQAFSKLLEAVAVALTALTPTAAKVLEAGAESLIIQAKAGAEVALIRVGVEKIQAETARVVADTEKRRAELVAPIETEAMVAKAEAMRSVQQLEAKKAAHELLNWVGRSAPKQAA